MTRQALNEFIEECQADIREMFVIPNEWLPEPLRQYKQYELSHVLDDDGFLKRTYGRTYGEIQKCNERRKKEQEVYNVHDEKARRVALYAQQYEEHCEQCESDGTNYLREPFEIEYEEPISMDIANLVDAMS